ncbi:MAG TPA: hypothetical protein DF610_17290 [Sphingobacterium sp.]|nr:hypothetical protein FM120_08540 [Sphingobacterium faecium PCAi_F2.5]HCU46349.1 hypothetical protein [Sphingobacterium sp.]
MSETFIKELDDLYIRYGYEPRKNKSTRVYLFTKSIYNGADIVKTGTDEEAEMLKKQYADSGYAVKVRNFKNVEEAEDLLFKDFFKADGVIQNLKRRYETFVGKLMNNLPENAEYKYIRSSYEYTNYKLDQDDTKTISVGADDDSHALVSTITKQINEHEGPLLIILEAAAGYGKTCTAYEILNEFISIGSNKLPFFTELSRDRKASVFKHILAFEIEEQFSNRVDSNVVIHQIKKGRIPLIIDGFDELISKDFSFSSNQFEQVESMLSTIVDLLTDNAKVIITSRKTAIFNSEEFHNWMIDRDIDYTLSKVTISEPSIDNWLPKERLEIIQSNNFPVEQIANPVLLTYLRYVNMEELKEMGIEGKSIVDRYFDFLLSREQTRQGLLIEPETQLRIFRKLVRFLTEWDVKAESKEFIKDLILDYNKTILEETKKKYTPDKRPRIDQLADILSNHAFLDRKEKGMIGIVNEFVFGTLIGENLIMGKYLQYSETFYEKLSQMFALLAIQAYQVQPKENKEELWNVFNTYTFPFDPQFYFKIDIEFKNEIIRNYKHAILNDFNLDTYSFTKKGQFESTIFTACTFTNCEFSFEAFKNSSFVNCRFFNCQLIDNGVAYSDSYFTVFGCTGDNEFVQNIFDYEDAEINEDLNIEKEILDLYFQIGGLKPRHRQLSYIKNELSGINYKSVSKSLHKLETNGIIQFNGDLSFLTRQGISYYNDKYKNS